MGSPHYIFSFVLLREYSGLGYTSEIAKQSLNKVAEGDDP